MIYCVGMGYAANQPQKSFYIFIAKLTPEGVDRDADIL